jgi:hypothetical protein
MSERPSTAIVKALAEFAGLRIEDTLNLLADPMAAAKLKTHREAPAVFATKLPEVGRLARARQSENQCAVMAETVPLTRESLSSALFATALSGQQIISHKAREENPNEHRS